MSHLKDQWLAQLPMIAAMCFNSQDEPDVKQAVDDALDIIEACDEAV